MIRARGRGCGVSDCVVGEAGARALPTIGGTSRRPRRVGMASPWAVGRSPGVPPARPMADGPIAGSRSGFSRVSYARHVGSTPTPATTGGAAERPATPQGGVAAISPGPQPGDRGFESRPCHLGQVAQPVERESEALEAGGSRPPLSTTRDVVKRPSHLVWDQGSAGSSPAIPTSGRSSTAERQVANLGTGVRLPPFAPRRLALACGRGAGGIESGAEGRRAGPVA